MVSPATQRVSIGREAAIALAETEWWESCSDIEIVQRQLFTEELCMPFGRFRQAIEAVLNRSVWTHEFGLNFDGIVAEFLDTAEAPTMEQITALIPAEKLVVVSLGKDSQ